uniref:Uncharacterized protein n=1 Tax=viral metagenome TaxID=1070528 RepID=A0A6C0I2K3_9ZZZZ
MDIVKAFNSNDLHTEIIIKGTVNDPLFRASDIGVVLELSNIRMSITDFDESEKVVSTADTLGGTQEVTFLTEKFKMHVKYIKYFENVTKIFKILK